MTSEPEQRDGRAAVLAELQHRVRNTLAAMRVIVRRSAKTSESLEDYVMHLEGRLNTMARVQNAFVRDPTAGFDVGLMVADELAACGAREGERVTIDGPAVELLPRAAETIQLAMHELSTNALKFGALSRPSGRLAVTWGVEERQGGKHLLLEWRERGVALAGIASRRGFGRTVLEEMLPNQLRGTAALSFEPDGLVYAIDVPLVERAPRPG